jgi:hypothetical protein
MGEQDQVDSGLNGERLTADREREIRLEEIYREEVRKGLATKPLRRRSRILLFLNTSLGLWLLSTLLVSVIGTLYTQARERGAANRAIAAENRLREQDRSDEIGRLDLEIGFRISNLLNYLVDKYREQLQAGENRQPAQPVTLEQFAAIIRSPPDASVQHGATAQSLYEDHKSTALVSLLAQLSRLEGQRIFDLEQGRMPPAPGDSLTETIERRRQEKDAIDNLTGHVSDPQRLFRGVDWQNVNAKALAAALNRMLLQPRWRGNLFSYMDCPAGEPFC